MGSIPTHPRHLTLVYPGGVIVLVLLDTGIRLGELMGLRADDVDLAGGQMRVFGKGRKERIVFLGQTVRKSLMRYLAIRSVVAKRTESSECALWLTKQGTALAEDTLQSQLRTYGKRAKADAPVTELLGAQNAIRQRSELRLVETDIGLHTIRRRTQ